MICTTEDERINFNRLIRARLPGNERGERVIEFNNLHRVLSSETRPFYGHDDDHGGWFEMSMFLDWFCVRDTNPNPVHASLVTYDSPFRYNPLQLSDATYGYVFSTSITQQTYPFSFDTIEQIIDCRSYMNYSFLQKHFAIEPMVDTIEEVVLVNQAFEDLCKAIARVLLQYKKSYDVENAVTVADQTSNINIHLDEELRQIA